MITAIQILIFVAYISFLLIRFKKPLPSISDSYYRLPGSLKNIFTFWCFAVGFLMLFQNSGKTPFFFFSGAGLCFTGAAAAFKEEMTGTVHAIGAFTCIIAGLLGLWFERSCPYAAIAFLVTALFIHYFVKANKTWWIELNAFFWIVLGLIFF